MIDWLTFLKNQITNELPGERAHVEMMPMRGLSSDALKKANNAKESAVAIHLLQKEKGIEILLTQRNTYEGAHSGQISFPGGKRDASDEDSIHTARRESFEEIAMPFENGELIGPMTEIYIPVSNFHVKPYVFFHSELTV
jgi:8-oxo-dGTP pyrophosphatase MutT (NUDIX family)